MLTTVDNHGVCSLPVMSASSGPLPNGSKKQTTKGRFLKWSSQSFAIEMTEVFWDDPKQALKPPSVPMLKQYKLYNRCYDITFTCPNSLLAGSA